MRRCTAFLCTVLLSASANGQSGSTHTVEILDLQLAMKAALRAVMVCNEAGFPVGASVVDRFGVEQVTLRSNLGAAHVSQSARRKARTAAAFSMSTSDLSRATREGEGRGTSDMNADADAGALMPAGTHAGGGLPIVSQAGELLGGIGVDGGGANDVKCAEAGLDAIAGQLK